MKILIAVFACLFGFVVGVPYASATDDVSESVVEEVTANVAERVTCAGIKSRLNELEINDENKDEIDKLKSDYRRFCTPKAAKRRASDSAAIMYAKSVEAKVAPKVVDSEEEKDPQLTETDVKTAAVAVDVATTDESVVEENDTPTKDVVSEDVVVESEPVDTRTPEEIQLEKELENLAAGLCTDGTKPNKFGCCTDETFKDLGNLVFACCPKDGGDCYEPIEANVSER